MRIILNYILLFYLRKCFHTIKFENYSGLPNIHNSNWIAFKYWSLKLYNFRKRIFFNTAWVQMWASQVVPVVKNMPDNAGNISDVGLNPGLRSPGGGHGNPLQDSCLESPMDWGTRRAMVYRVAKSWTWRKRLSRHTHAAILMAFNSWHLK